MNDCESGLEYERGRAASDNCNITGDSVFCRILFVYNQLIKMKIQTCFALDIWIFLLLDLDWIFWISNYW